MERIFSFSSIFGGSIFVSVSGRLCSIVPLWLCADIAHAIETSCNLIVLFSCNPFVAYYCRIFRKSIHFVPATDSRSLAITCSVVIVSYIWFPPYTVGTEEWQCYETRAQRWRQPAISSKYERSLSEMNGKLAFVSIPFVLPKYNVVIICWSGNG